MDNYTIFRCSKTLVEAGKQEILQQINVPKILDLKSSSEQIFSENWSWVICYRFPNCLPASAAEYFKCLL